MTISFIRTILLYVVIILAVRLMGKRQISELQTTELVVTMLISDIASIPMQDTGQPLTSGLIPIFILIACEIIVSIVMMKNSKFRKLVCGCPLVVINDGKINQRQMRRLRMSTEDLFEQLRQLDVFSISDVSYAIVETNGKMSIMKKPEKQEVDAQMMGIEVTDVGIEVVVVNDGEVAQSSLKIFDFDEEWLKKILLKENLMIKDIFIMTANKKGQYNIIKKE